MFAGDRRKHETLHAFCTFAMCVSSSWHSLFNTVNITWAVFADMMLENCGKRDGAARAFARAQRKDSNSAAARRGRWVGTATVLHWQAAGGYQLLCLPTDSCCRALRHVIVWRKTTIFFLRRRALLPYTTTTQHTPTTSGAPPTCHYALQRRSHLASAPS